MAGGSSGVNENSSLCIVVVDHRQPSVMDRKTRSSSCSISGVLIKTTHVSIRNDGMRALVARPVYSAVATF